MTAVHRLFFGSVVFLVFIASGFATGADWRLSNEAAWILSQIKSNRITKEEPEPGKASEKTPPERIYCGQKVYPSYPAMLDTKPDIPSPYTTLGAVEVVTAFTKDGNYTLVAVTVKNGKPLNYAQRQWGKGRQLEVDACDFPHWPEPAFTPRQN